MSKRAFVTGATGFLGIHLMQQLHKAGWQITAIHRSPINHPMLNNLPVDWQKASLDNVQELKNALPNKSFTVFHLAADTSQWKPLHQRQYQTNVIGTQNLIEAIREKNLGRMIHVSSISAFGQPKGTISEETASQAPHGNHNYSLTKWQGEERIKKAVQEHDLPAVIVNPCHIIGPWDTNNWIELFKAVLDEDLPGIPPAAGSFCWVEEVAKAIITATEKGNIGENYILGGPHMSMLELINEIQRQSQLKLSKKASPAALLHLIEPIMRVGSWFTGKQPQLTPDRVIMLTHDVLADDSKAQKELNYAHKSPKDLVKQTLAWLKNHERNQA